MKAKDASVVSDMFSSMRFRLKFGGVHVNVGKDTFHDDKPLIKDLRLLPLP